HQPARQATEERDPQPLFEDLHLMADGGLRDAELDRRTGERKMPGGGLEGAQRVQRKMWPDHAMPQFFLWLPPVIIVCGAPATGPRNGTFTSRETYHDPGKTRPSGRCHGRSCR